MSIFAKTCLVEMPNACEECDESYLHASMNRLCKILGCLNVRSYGEKPNLFTARHPLCPLVEVEDGAVRP
jgi:hypothetical protein